MDQGDTVVNSVVSGVSDLSAFVLICATAERLLNPFSINILFLIKREVAIMPL